MQLLSPCKRLPTLLVALASIALRGFADNTNVDLLKQYPTTLTTGDTQNTRAWQFTASDIFRISQFNLEVGKGLRIAVGMADLGIGHSADGAVWAIVIPRAGGKLTSSATDEPENISHIWLRFHPGEIDRLFQIGRAHV